MKPTWEELIEAFNQYLASCDKSNLTRSTYLAELKKFSEWIQVEPDQVADIDIKEYRQWLYLNKKLKPTTVNKALVTLKKFYTWANEAKLLDRNPAAHIKLVEVEAPPPKWLSRSEELKYRRELQRERNPRKRTRDSAVISAMIDCGLRVSEVSFLELDDVVVAPKSGKVVVRKGKRYRHREVPLNADARKAFEEYLLIRHTYPQAQNSNYLFVSERANRLTQRAIQHLVEEYAYRAKIKVTPHTLRHTFGHNLALAGRSLTEIQKLMGHKNINTTAIYLTPGEEELISAVESISWRDK
mgnify:CR=1 FL=1|jgi:integrase/recombinase XerD